MRIKPSTCRVHAFFDGQNIYQAAKAFGHPHPDFDPIKLANWAVATNSDRSLTQVHFYTGIHDARENRFWNQFWTNRLNALGRQGVRTVHRVLKYSNQPVEVTKGQFKKVRIGREKGIDVRIALDLVRLARQAAFDVAIVFSQDQDLAEAVSDVKAISTELDRWIRVESAFPYDAAVSATLPKPMNSRGINGAAWLPIDKSTFDACIDPTDYRPKKAQH